MYIAQERASLSLAQARYILRDGELPMTAGKVDLAYLENGGCTIFGLAWPQRPESCICGLSDGWDYGT